LQPLQRHRPHRFLAVEPGDGNARGEQAGLVLGRRRPRLRHQSDLIELVAGDPLLLGEQIGGERDLDVAPIGRHVGGGIIIRLVGHERDLRQHLDPTAQRPLRLARRDRRRRRAHRRQARGAEIVERVHRDAIGQLGLELGDQRDMPTLVADTAQGHALGAPARIVPPRLHRIDQTRDEPVRRLTGQPTIGARLAAGGTQRNVEIGLAHAGALHALGG
jgi:hypothetical protein